MARKHITDRRHYARNVRQLVVYWYRYLLPDRLRRELWHRWHTGRGYNAAQTYAYPLTQLFPDRPIPFPQQVVGTQRVAIIIVTYNNLPYIQLTLQSILAVTDHAHYHIIIIDNGSTVHVTAYLTIMQQYYPTYLTVIANADNRGFAAATNQGIVAATTGAAPASTIVLLNSDVIVTAGWLTRLLLPLQHHHIGMVGPTTNRVGNEAYVAVPYRHLDGIAPFAARQARRYKGLTLQVRMLSMYCVALRSEVVIAIGPLDERFGMGYFEDDDYAERLQRAGYALWCVRDVFVHHFGSATFSQLEQTRFATLFAHNQRLFEEKWHTTWVPQRSRPSPLRQWAAIFFSKVH